MAVRAFLSRLRGWGLIVLIGLDQMGAAVVFGFFWTIEGGERPDPDETISSRIGRAAVKGHWWGRAAEVAINALFLLFGEANHCRRHIGS